ncbi:MAG: Glycerophosphoryl diester phosphodiesterase [uncultured Nocardioidaceae bacterium]|uniref:Glycerophosphoryl diester phosphodiesterase n=1 Tax=uncultured Nocardioidaceae bacterium TaxID=253824 RepID=A0A6J4LK41_9ACTN|nr:MAG: Glycerophosphoryl diester phosphodiesterase [uncultured Nocardioidaceae bacterium]
MITSGRQPSGVTDLLQTASPSITSAPTRSTAPGRPSTPITVAHRGASAEAPENTLCALRRAVETGADMVEIDVQRTRDGALVLMHDSTLLRTTDVRTRFPGRSPWRVEQLDHDEIRALDAGSWLSPRFAGEVVPTVAEAIEVLRGSGTGLLLELKLPEHHPGVVPDLVQELETIPGYLPGAVASGSLVVQSFDVAAMKQHKTLAPAVPVGLLGRPRRSNLPALSTWAQYVNPAYLCTDQAYVARVQQLGMRCLTWTVDAERSMHRAARLGVDGIITNRPQRLHSVLRATPFDDRAAGYRVPTGTAGARRPTPSREE